MATYTTNLNLKKPDGDENMNVLDINGNMDLLDAAYGDMKDLKVNTSTFTSVASLVSYIQNFYDGMRMMVSVDDTIGATFFGATTSTNFTMILYKASDSNAYYWAFARDKIACGNIALSDGTVSIKYSSDNQGVLYTSQALDDKSAASGSTVAVGSISLPAGEYVITLLGNWASNANGYRQIWLSESSGGVQVNLAATSIVAAASGLATRQHLTITYKSTSAITLYAVAKQNSGSTLTLNTRYSVARIK